MKRAPLTGLELEQSVRAQLYGAAGQVVATGVPGAREDPRRAGLGRLLAGRYRLLELLGAGGMATVYRARDERLRRHVAVKVIAPGLVHDAVAVRRLRREAELGARLMHTNIVTVLDAGVEPQDFIAMELVDGVEARTLAGGTGHLTLQHAIDIIGPICDALQYAHDQHVIHGDVSDSNILVRHRDGLPKLADFGLACHTGETQNGRRGRVTGTPGYIAPELLEGADPSAASDLYSLAAVTQGLLVGPADRRPAHRGTTVRVTGTSGSVPLARTRPDLPRAATDAVERALSPEPDARQESVAEFRAQLTGERVPPLQVPNAA